MMILRALLLAVMLSSAPLEAASADSKSPIVAAADSEVLAFLTLLQAGKSREAVDQLMSSPLWQQKIGGRETVLGQIDAAIRAYGPATAFEKIDTESIGTMARRDRYLVQHRDMVVRWEFYLVRAATGWQIGYFGFTDEPKAMF